MKDVRENVAEIVNQSYVLSFACVNTENDQPYQVWMHYCGDLERIIVYSRRDRLHSEFVSKNSKVSIAILPDQIPGYGVRGLSGQGTICELTDEDEIVEAEQKYCSRFNRDDVSEQARSGQADHHAFWEIKMTDYVLFDFHNYPEDPRKELKV